MIGAAQLSATGRIGWVDDVPPLQGDDDTLVRTCVAAICGSDLHVVDGGWGKPDYPSSPGFPGHESVVEVVADPTGTFEPGDRALAVPPAAESRAFAQMQAIRPSALIPLRPDEAPDRFVFAQQLGTVIHALDVFAGRDLADRTVAIAGAGTAGCMFAYEAHRRGARQVIVSDPHPARREVVGRLGVGHAVPPDRFVATVQEVTVGLGAELVVDASGTDHGRRDAVAALARDGTVGMFGLPERHGPSTFELGRFFEQRARLVATHGTQTETGLPAFHEAVDLIRDGSFDPGIFSVLMLPLAAIAEGFIRARRRDEVHKILLRPDG